MAPVASNGATLGPTFGPYKRNNPRTTVSGAEVDSNSVYKHGPLLLTPIREGRLRGADWRVPRI